jgi:hypothetical protein
MSEGISYYTVKLAAFVALRSADRVLGLAGAELAKVLGRLGNDIFEELKGDAAKGLTYLRGRRGMVSVKVLIMNRYGVE